MDWDAFISHASEDKDAIARPLAQRLQERGLRVWFDEFTLVVGDSLRRSIDAGLARSRFGIVVLSQNFFQKEWPQKELDGLVSREIEGVKVILPVWHGVNADIIRRYSPTLADRLAVASIEGLDVVADRLLQAINKPVAPLLVVDSSVKAALQYSEGSETGIKIYCDRCGAVPGARSECAPGYSTHDFVRATKGAVYCYRCGAMPGARSECAPGYSTHDFIRAAKGTVYCDRCGAMPGPRSKCAPGYSTHDFVQASAGNVYCHRCGAVPGARNECSLGYATHDFVRL